MTRAYPGIAEALRRLRDALTAVRYERRETGGGFNVDIDKLADVLDAADEVVHARDDGLPGPPPDASKMRESLAALGELTKGVEFHCHDCGKLKTRCECEVNALAEAVALLRTIPTDRLFCGPWTRQRDEFLAKWGGE